jgi:pyruvate,orthophosphate dikinase
VTVNQPQGSVIILNGAYVPDKALIGGKAWSIANMSALGLNVPPAFVITTQGCIDYFSAGGIDEQLVREIESGIAWLEDQSGKRFGGGPRPLLVSVRSGAAVSMPGMMDTVLNLGITDQTEALLAAEWSDAAFARDVHRRFLELYAKIVLKADAMRLKLDASPVAWREAIAAAAGAHVPTDVHDQLFKAIGAVFDSWNSARARRYRKHQAISNDLGTAVTVQSMVFGNLDHRSGTGVLFSRNPLTGEKRPFGEYLPRAQGEEIVSGSHTPAPLEAMSENVADAMQELLRSADSLERLHGDVQDIEFTVERGRLYFLQTRSAKRAPYAAVCIAEAMVKEGHIDPNEALRRVSPDQIRLLLTPRLADGAAANAAILARGEGASPGIASGVVVLEAETAETRTKAGEQIVLARATTSPNDLHGMIAAKATITEQGGTTSHAAVVARALGKPCVVGCGVDALMGLTGKRVTVDGATGVIYAGELETEIRREETEPMLSQLLAWGIERAPVPVLTAAPAQCHVVDLDLLANAEEPEAIAEALKNLPPGACVRGAILSTNDAAVQAALRAGAGVIVTYPRLPALLVAVQYQPAKN